jgi:hypothetical protein
MEIIFEIVLEFLGPMILELFGSIFKRSSNDEPRNEKAVHPAIKFFAYGMYGAICGFISLAIFAHHMIDSPILRIANLIASPLFAGFVMMQLGAWLTAHGKKRSPINRFAYGFCFALGFSLVRFLFAGRV